ncbi:ABC-type multidrug transport system, ATPase component [Longilinea arvoryzae]|uniref:ABC-type multidrug transport system, ATPase component n=1 Tax=Longilinea arvoryzae TaxID=360412 RepID=A0A0S7BLR9_9CHLR|nr:ABC transporter ATP-binding protein [Longilinea arvoryzae]GAP15138.1 ABC-type multidrug transport system, ATPase component [Longilinea arvoryzae]
MIFTRNLTKKFNDLLAVDGVDLDVASGQILTLLGPNGAGKTTTVRMLTSVLTPTCGTAKVAGFDVVSQADKVRASVGVLTESHGLYRRMNALEYLDFFGELYGMPASERRRRAADLMEMFGLADAARRRLGEYSKGMRQKLALVRAMIHNPPVLLLDEPTSAMDPESARMVRDAILSLRSRDRTIVLCTHNLSEAEELADQIAIIRRGKIISYGTLAELEEQYLGVPEYEIRFASPIQDFSGFPPDLAISERGCDWVRFRSPDPFVQNPLLLRSLMDNGLPVVTLREVGRSLESAYLEAVNHPNGEVRHA